MTRSELATSSAKGAMEQSGTAARVDVGVQERLRSCPYCYYFGKISWRYDRGTLTLEGRVASFYLKQVLQTVLRDVEHVQRIVNAVDVVSSTGLSSEHDT